METANINQIPRDELHRLSRQISDLEGMLRAQHDILRQRGIEMPPDVLEKLFYMRSDLENLTGRLVDESTELDQLRALAKTTRLINSSLEPDEVLNEVLDTAIALTGAERGYIVLRSSEHRANFSSAPPAISTGRRIDESKFTVSQTIMMEAAETGQPVIAMMRWPIRATTAQKSIVAARAALDYLRAAHF